MEEEEKSTYPPDEEEIADESYLDEDLDVLDD